MYDELIKTLRFYSEFEVENPVLTADVFAQAADTIEELTAENKRLKRKIRDIKSSASWDEDIRRGQVQGMWQGGMNMRNLFGEKKVVLSMSLLIKGMEMPKEGEYPAMLYVFSDGSGYIDFGTLPSEEDRFEIVPVPPHGRLGDLDAAVELAMQYCHDDDGTCSKAGADLRELLDEIESLPTVIPADPAEEGET